MGPISCPETQVTNYKSTLHNIPEKRWLQNCPMSRIYDIKIETYRTCFNILLCRTVLVVDTCSTHWTIRFYLVGPVLNGNLSETLYVSLSRYCCGKENRFTPNEVNRELRQNENRQLTKIRFRSLSTTVETRLSILTSQATCPSDYVCAGR